MVGEMYGRGGYPGFAPYAVHAHNGFPFLGVIFLILLVIVLAVLAALVFRWLVGRRSGWLRPAVVSGVPMGDVLAVVRMRYARGEIDRDQFLQATADLSGPTAPAESPPDAPTAA